MTLKEFAAQQGLNYALARQWVKRGKIVKVTGGYSLKGDKVTESDGAANEKVTAGDSAAEKVTPLVTLEGDSPEGDSPEGDGQPYVRSSSGATPERIAAVRKRLEDSGLRMGIDLFSLIAELQQQMANHAARLQELGERVSMAGHLPLTGSCDGCASLREQLADALDRLVRLEGEQSKTQVYSGVRRENGRKLDYNEFDDAKGWNS